MHNIIFEGGNCPLNIFLLDMFLHFYNNSYLILGELTYDTSIDFRIMLIFFYRFCEK